MAETMIFQPKPIEGMIKVPASADSGKLDQEVKTFCRGQFAIGSASYYQVAGEIPWLAISKSIQNQMAAKSIGRIPIFTVMQLTMRYVNWPFVSDSSIVPIYSMSAA